MSICWLSVMGRMLQRMRESGIGISHIVVSDDSSNPSIMVWTRVDQDGSLRKMRSYEYDIVDARLVDVDCFAR